MRWLIPLMLLGCSSQVEEPEPIKIDLNQAEINKVLRDNPLVDPPSLSLGPKDNTAVKYHYREPVIYDDLCHNLNVPPKVFNQHDLGC